MGVKNPEKSLLELMKIRNPIITDRDKPPSFFTDEYILSELNSSELKYNTLDNVPNAELKEYFRHHTKTFGGGSWYLDKIKSEKAQRIGEEIGYGYYKIKQDTSQLRRPNPKGIFCQGF